MADLVDRQEAIKALCKAGCDSGHCGVSCPDVMAIEHLPSAERHGKWLEHKDYPELAYLCSECNWFTTDRSFYCPHCGARMDGGTK